MGDRHPIPDRGLDHDRGRGLGDLRGGAAHHTGQTDCLVGGVDDDAVVGRDGAFDVVQGRGFDSPS